MARFSPEDNAVDIEPRDINFWFGAGARLYAFKEKRAPEVIRCPMFESIPHPTEPGKTIPVEWLLPSDETAQDIVSDGSNVPEATPEVIKELDVEDDEKIELKKKIEALGSQLEESHQALEELITEVSTEGVTVEEMEAIEVEETGHVIEEAQPPAREVVKEQAGTVIPVGSEIKTPEGKTLRLTETGWQEVQQYVPDKPSKARSRKKAPTATTESPVTEEAPVAAVSASDEVPDIGLSDEDLSPEERQAAANARRKEAAAKVTTSPRHPDTVIAPGGVGLGGPGRDKTDQAMAQRYMRPEPDLGAVPGGDSGHGTPEGGDAEAGGTPEEFLAAKAAQLTGESGESDSS